MFNCWLLTQLSLRNLFKCVCALLSAFLVFQELYNYVVIKPTTSAKEEKELKSSDIPETVICGFPGFDDVVLTRYGYATGVYYRGSMDGTHFIGWNGNKNESKSSKTILEEAITVNTNFLSLFQAIEFSKDNENEITLAKTEFRTLTFPIGRCLAINPPKNRLKSTNFNTLHIMVNKTVAELGNIEELRVFFMDRANSVKIYPNDMEMTGDTVWLRIKNGQAEFKSIKTKIYKFVHVEGDPLFDCAEYTENKSYSNCAYEELLKDFREELGCDPPLLNTESEKMCNQIFNFSETKETKIRALFKPMYFHNREFRCKTPCSKSVFSSKYLGTSPSGGPNQISLAVAFDPMMDETHSSFAINEQTLLVRLGGTVSTGRTLLWILVSILAASQV